MKSEQIKIPLTRVAYTAIKKGIITLFFRPGEILYIQQIANDLNISRTPVREALVMLSKEGLVEPGPGGKFKISEIKLSTIFEIYDLRQNLETYAIKHKFLEYKELDIDYLLDNHCRHLESIKSKNFEKCFMLDQQFHMYFFKKLGNNLLTDFMNRMYDIQQRVRYLTAEYPERLTLTPIEHMAIIESIRKKDFLLVQNCIKDHLDNVKAVFLNSHDKQYNPPLARSLESSKNLTEV